MPQPYTNRIVSVEFLTTCRFSLQIAEVEDDRVVVRTRRTKASEGDKLDLPEHTAKRLLRLQYVKVAS